MYKHSDNLPEDRFFLPLTAGTRAHVTFVFSAVHLLPNSGSWQLCQCGDLFII